MSLKTQLEKLKVRAPIGIEVWDGTDRDDGLFECVDHPGVLLGDQELDEHAIRANVQVIQLVNEDAP